MQKLLLIYITEEAKETFLHFKSQIIKYSTPNLATDAANDTTIRFSTSYLRHIANSKLFAVFGRIKFVLI